MMHYTNWLPGYNNVKANFAWSASHNFDAIAPPTDWIDTQHLSWYETSEMQLKLRV